MVPFGPPRLALSFLLFLPLVAEVGAQIDEVKPPVPSPQNDHVELLIRATDGRIAWREVAGSLAESLSLDVKTVENVLPRGSIPMHSELFKLAASGVRLATRNKIAIKVVHDANEEPALVVRCDRSLFGVKPAAPFDPPTIDVDNDWDMRSDGRPIVVCIHGMQSEPGVWDPMRDFFREAGFATASIGYDDAQSIAESARQAATITTQFFDDADVDTKPRLALVGHSMGGLVAREWTENGSLPNDRISHLFTIASPHQGSSWASMPPLLDLVSKGEFDLRDVVDVVTHQPSAASLRELEPGSEFLRSLAERDRRADVRYATMAGTGSPISESRVEKIGTRLRSVDNKSRIFRLLSPRIQPLVDGFDELMRGKGDGVVAADRAVIEGVVDSSEFDLSHGEIIRPTTGTEQPVWAAILKRLR